MTRRQFLADPARLSDEAIDCYLAPCISTPSRRTQLNKYIAGFVPNPLPEIEPALRRFPGPARIIWGTGDPLFDRKWATWLDEALPDSTGVRWVEGVKLFFAEERPQVIIEEVARLWR